MNNGLTTALIASEDRERDFGQRRNGNPLDEVEADRFDWFLSTGVILRDSEDLPDVDSDFLLFVFRAADFFFLFDHLLDLLLNDLRLLDDDDRLRLRRHRFHNDQLLLGVSC